MVPNHGNRRYQQTFVGRMYSTQRRAERHHVQTGILLAEQSAFQSGMYPQYFRFLAKQGFVSFHCNFQNVRFRIHFPTRIAFAHFHTGTGQFKSGFHHIAHVVARTQYAAALTGFHLNLIAVRQTDTGQIGTGLHQIDVLRHGKDAVVHGL